MKKKEIENLIHKVNNKFNIDLRSKNRTQLSAYLKMIIVNKTALHESILAEMLNRNRCTIIYYRQMFTINKNYLDFRELIEKVEQLN
jgi:hypothetical protein